MKLFQDRALETLSCKQSSLGTGLREIQLSPPGTVNSRVGTYLMDSTAAHDVIQNFDAHGNAIPLDWDHSLLTEPPGHAPAAGFIHKIWFDERRGLRGLIEWTPAGRRSIQDGSYRYLSPVFMVEPATRRPVSLHSAALTNKPAIPRMERLAASETFKKKELWTMAEEPNQKSPEAVLGQIAGLLEVEPGANPLETLEAILAAVKEIVEDGEGSEGDTGGAVAVANAVRTRLKLSSTAGATEVAAALSLAVSGSAEVAGLRAEARNRSVEDVLRPWVTKGLLHPDSEYAPDQTLYSDMLALAERDPNACVRLMERMPYPPQGRTTAPNQADMTRANLIKNAEREYRADEALQASTSAKAYASLALRDQDLGALTDDECLALPH